jgi:hypothetical protein
MKNWIAWAPNPSSVSIRFLSSIALSSWAVPSVASRSSSALTMPCTNRLARRIATIPAMTMRTIGMTYSRANGAMSVQGAFEKSGIA